MERVEFSAKAGNGTERNFFRRGGGGEFEMRKQGTFFALLLILLFLTACGGEMIPPPPEEPDVSPAETPETPPEQEEEEAPEDPGEAALQALLKGMTLEEKAGQLFFVRVPAENALEDIMTYHLGGYLLFGRDTQDKTANDLIQTIASWQAEAVEHGTGIPLLVGVDEEGGTVARASRNPNLFPEKCKSPQKLFAEGAWEAIEQDAVDKNSGLLSYGINVNFAPVADVWWNSDNTVVEKRSFGSDPELVAQMTAEAVKGLQEHGVSATLKHFPGHGGTSKDSHDEIASVSETIQEMDKKDLVPFKAGIEAGADQVMIGHICTPKASDEDIPATFSYFWVTEVLRAYLGFEGVAITDALNMGAITQKYTSAEASIKALEAGADMLLMPENFEEAYQGVLEAVKDGTLKEARVDESLARIFRLKYKKIPQRLPF